MTRGERIMDWIKFGVEVYLLVCITVFTGAAFFGVLKADYAQGFRAGFFCAFLLPLVGYWVYDDFHKLRRNKKSLTKS